MDINFKFPPLLAELRFQIFQVLHAARRCTTTLRSFSPRGVEEKWEIPMLNILTRGRYPVILRWLVWTDAVYFPILLDEFLFLKEAQNVQKITGDTRKLGKLRNQDTLERSIRRQRPSCLGKRSFLFRKMDLMAGTEHTIAGRENTRETKKPPFQGNKHPEALGNPARKGPHTLNWFIGFIHRWSKFSTPPKNVAKDFSRWGSPGSVAISSWWYLASPNSYTPLATSNFTYATGQNPHVLIYIYIHTFLLTLDFN